MRVSDTTRHGETVRNLQNSSGRLQEIQEKLSSGRRINRYSDDPIGAAQVQDHRTRVSHAQAVKRAVQDNYVWLDRTEQELQQSAELLNRAKGIVITHANDTFDAETRRLAANELEDILRSLIDIGNNRLGKVHLFAGSSTLKPPLVKNPEVTQATIDGGGLTTQAALALGKQSMVVDVEGHFNREYEVRVVKEGGFGEAHFVVSDDGGKTFSREQLLRPVIELVNPHGLPSEKTQMRFEGSVSNTQMFFDEGLMFKVQPNPYLTYVGDDAKRLAPIGDGKTRAINLTAPEIFWPQKSDGAKEDDGDTFTLLKGLIEALKSDDGKTLSARLGEIDRALNRAFLRRSDVGIVSKTLQDRLQTMDDREFLNTQRISVVEDLDVADASIDLNTAETKYRSVLHTGERLLAPSLLDFLR